MDESSFIVLMMCKSMLLMKKRQIYTAFYMGLTALISKENWLNEKIYKTLF